MKKLLSRLGIFLFILLLFNIAFSYIVWKAYYREYSAVALNFDTYLLADSRGEPIEDFLKGIGVYNFSQGSDSYPDMLRKLKYLAKNTRVKRIIITVDDHTLSRFREGLNNLDRSIIYAFPEDFDSKFEYYKIRYIKRYIVFFNSKSRDILKTRIKIEIPNGKNNDHTEEWGSLNQEKRLELAKERIEYHFAFKEKSKQMSRALDEIMSFCHTNDIELIGIKFPLSNDYYNLIKERGYKADSLIKDSGYIVMDFTTLYVNNDDYFFNQDHLNKEGGKAFADTLIRYLTY